MRARAHAESGPLRVLFVCTANIARSPYAERRMAHLVAGLPGGALVLSSAGIPGVPGRGMDRHLATELRARGGEPNGHVSRALTHRLLDDVELVLTFEFAHQIRISQEWPDQAVKVFGLHQFADAVGRVGSPARGLELLDQAYAACRPNGLTWNVADPHGHGAAAARACADEIDAALEVIVPALSGVSLHGRGR